MLPTFDIVGDFVLVDFLTWKYSRINRFDLLVYASPESPQRLVLKRVIGLPGDNVYVDPTVSKRRITVPEGHLWMQGDNYSHSNDSRHYGPVPMGLVKGRILKKLSLPWHTGASEFNEKTL